MTDEKLYQDILAMTKRYLSSSPASRRLEVNEVANAAYIIAKTGSAGFKAGGNIYYAIQKAVDPRCKANTHVRHEGIHSAFHAEGFFDTMQDKRTAEFEIDMYDAIQSLPIDQRLAICQNIDSGKADNKHDLLAGQKAMRDIYDRN